MPTDDRGHEIQAKPRSPQRRKRDVRGLARGVHLHVSIAEWSEPQRGSLTTLTGLYRAPGRAQGRGSDLRNGAALAPNEGHGGASPPAHSHWETRETNRGQVEWGPRAIFRHLHTSAEVARATASGDNPSELPFHLRPNPRQPTGPRMNPMLHPALRPAAENLSRKIAPHLLRSHGAA